MIYDLKTLNEEQMKPLLQTEGAVLVTAGAGSGKTRLLTHRIVYIIEKGIDPYNILAITFTNKATGEMKERINQMTNSAQDVWISTFHSLCARILRRELDVITGYSKDFSIYSESDSEKIKKQVLIELDAEDDKIKKGLYRHLSNWKCTVKSLDEYFAGDDDEDNIIIKKAMFLYEKKLQENNALDFDDLLIKTYQLFKNHPDVLRKYANRFKYVLVDEFQDTNVVQYEIVKQLASIHKNVFAVGDEDQCIYSWRGANFQNIFNFKKDFNDVKVFKLERNYRSSPEILNIANNLIKNNISRLDKKLWTEKESVCDPKTYTAYDERDEANFVAREISNLISKGAKFSDFAILMRVNALSRSFEESLLSYNISHKVYGGFKFFERVEIKNVIAYLRLFVNPKDDISFERVVNFPKRGVGDGALLKIKEMCNGNNLLDCVLAEEFENESAVFKKLQGFISAFKSLKVLQESLTLTDFVKQVITIFDIRLAYNSKVEEDFNKLMNIDSFIASCQEFEKANKEATLSQYLESVTLMSDTEEIGNDGAVVIATIHSVKGLEFKNVFVVGCEEGVFPGARSLSSNTQLEEERRLMYVAVTRAEEKVFLTNCNKRYIYGRTSYQMPSRFLKELGIIKTKKNEKVQTSSKPFSFPSFFKKENKEEVKVNTSKYAVGQKVEHPRYGEGEILQISSDGLVGDINFDDFGNKSLMLEIAPLEILGDGNE